jgi:hypothetical protein
MMSFANRTQRNIQLLREMLLTEYRESLPEAQAAADRALAAGDMRRHHACVERVEWLRERISEAEARAA